MKHNMGDTSLHIWFFGWRYVNGYGSNRLYYRFRNYIYLLRLSYIPLSWKIGTLKDLLDSFYTHAFFSSNRLENFNAMLLGLWDGMKSNMGIRQIKTRKIY
jgi:rhamnosyltransferase